MSSLHEARLAWERGARSMAYEEYGRNHEVTFGTGAGITMSAAPEFRGDPTKANPEELLVAALSSCHMLTFLAICARQGLIVDRYEDHAVGLLDRPPGKRVQLTKATLRPRITFVGTPPDESKLAAIHHQAHQECFIANSVTTEVVISPQ